MTLTLSFLLLGLGAGGVYALLGLGVVLQHRASGVVNFAHGATAMFCAYVYTQLRINSVLVLPLPSVIGQISLGHGPMPFYPALFITLVYGAALGLLLWAVLFRPLRSRALLAKIVACIGVMLALQGIATLLFGDEIRTSSPLFPSGPVSVFGAIVSADRLWLAGVALVAALLLALLYGRTEFGRASRAVSVNHWAAALSGIRVELIEGANWALASVLAAAAGIVMLPLTSLQGSSYSLFILPALAAALIGNLNSFTFTALGGLAIGMLQSWLTQLVTNISWLPQAGMQDAVPFLIIMAAFAVRGQSVPSRGDMIEPNLRASAPPKRLVSAIAAGIALPLAGLFLLSGPYRLGLIGSGVEVVLCLSFVVLTGFVGQISLAQLGFAGIGGFVMAKLATAVSIPAPVALLAGGLIVVPVGILIGLPALRVRGINLAIVTLGAGVAISSLVLNSSLLDGGYSGQRVPAPKLFGLDLSISGQTFAGYPRPVFGVFVLIVVVVMALLVANLRRSPTGLHLLAVRSNERAAQAAGIPVANAKLFAFGFAAFLAGIGGGLLGYQQGQLSPDGFDVMTSLALLAVAYIGGLRRIGGAVFAGVMLASSGLGGTIMDRLLGLGNNYQMTIAGIALAVSAVLSPDGVVAIKDLTARRKRRIDAGMRPADGGIGSTTGGQLVPTATEE